MDLIIRNGTIVTADTTCQADIAVSDGKVRQIASSLPAIADIVIDARGQFVFPGGVDVHTHLDLPGQGTITADDFRSGTIAAACGGTTTIVDFCFQAKGQTLAEALDDWHSKARGKSAIDYGFHVVIVDMSEAVMQEIATLPSLGVTSLKLFLAYKGTTMVDDWTLIRALDQAKKYGALVMVHPEHGDAVYFLQQRLLAEGKRGPLSHSLSRPPRVEAEATARAIALAEILEAPIYIVHVSCGEALEEIVRGRKRGVQVLGETCPQYLYLSEDDLKRDGFEGAKFVFTPPPRQKHQQDVLWSALASGVIQAVNSDHSSFNYREQKELGRHDFTKIPNGGPGIEERLMLVYQGVQQGRLTLNRFVDVVATSPAKMFGLYPKKGTIAIGSDADLVVWDPGAVLVLSPSVLHQNVDYTMYDGMSVSGVPNVVVLRGEVIVRNREYVGRPGMGQFVMRDRFQSPSI